MTNSPTTFTLELIFMLGMFRPVVKLQHLTQTLGQFWTLQTLYMQSNLATIATCYNITKKPGIFQSLGTISIVLVY